MDLALADSSPIYALIDSAAIANSVETTITTTTMATFNVTAQAAAAALASTVTAVANPSTFKEATPNFGHLTLLVFEAVMEVVCVSFPGYMIARSGMFDAGAQKFVANLNINLFTPCLIFSKLAAQLSPDKFVDLAIIPVILVVQTCISWAVAQLICRFIRLKKRPQVNFVTAMAVFGNSNSLPLSMIISLSKTISGLHWDKIPGDNDNEVAARGILYLLVFSQFGQALRWSWGMNSLLKPFADYAPEDMSDEEEENPYEPYEDNPLPTSILTSPSGFGAGKDGRNPIDAIFDNNGPSYSRISSDGTPGQARPPITPLRSNTTRCSTGLGAMKQNGVNGDSSNSEARLPTRTRWQKVHATMNSHRMTFNEGVKSRSIRIFHSLPENLQRALNEAGRGVSKVFRALLACMNPPLVAIIISVIVASIPALQRVFFTPGTFINNSVTRAVTQSGAVAVPLILVVLGANLAKNTLPDEGLHSPQYEREEKKMLVAALLSRMVLTTALMAPLLVLAARFVPVSILDDPIFIIVCFLLTGAPSALQLAQMCQVNSVYVGAVSRLLFHSYVIWILPSTLILVVAALETVNFARS